MRVLCFEHLVGKQRLASELDLVGAFCPAEATTLLGADLNVTFSSLAASPFVGRPPLFRSTYVLFRFLSVCTF